MKGNLKYKLIAILLCIVMIIVSINLSNIFDNNFNAAISISDLESPTYTWTSDGRTVTNLPITNWKKSSGFSYGSTNSTTPSWNLIKSTQLTTSSVWSNLASGHQAAGWSGQSGTSALGTRFRGSFKLDPTLPVNDMYFTASSVSDDGYMYVNDGCFVFIYPTELYNLITDDANSPYYYGNFLCMYLTISGGTALGKTSPAFEYPYTGYENYMPIGWRSKAITNNAGDVMKYGYNLVKDENYSGEYIIDIFGFDTASSGGMLRWKVGADFSKTSIAYAGNGGNGTMEIDAKSTSGTEIPSFTIKENAFTKIGYRFTGWNTAADGSGQSYNVGDVYNSKSSMILYAQWEKIEAYVNCIDVVGSVSSDGNFIKEKEMNKLTSKLYQYGETAKGSDWGAISPYVNYKYFGDTSIVLKEESIPDSAFDTSDITSGKTEITNSYDSNNFNATEIYNQWTSYPNPTTTDVSNGWIVNDGHLWKDANKPAYNNRFSQQFYLEQTKDISYIDMSADFVMHSCCLGSGFVVSWNEEKDCAYIIILNDSWGNTDANAIECGVGQVVLKRIDNFSTYVNAGLPLTPSGKRMPLLSTNLPSTNLISAKVKDFVKSGTQTKCFTGQKNGKYWFESFPDEVINLRYTVDDGLLTCYVNNNQVFTYDMGSDFVGYSGLFFNCVAAATNVNVTTKTSYSQTQSVVCINPNGGIYENSTDKKAYYGLKDSSIEISTPIRDGYVFLGWEKSENFTGNINENKYTYGDAGSIDCLVAKWAPNIVYRYFVLDVSDYTILHQQEQLDGTYKTIDTEKLTGTIGTSITPIVKTYEGFTSPSPQTVTIKENGGTTVIYKYIRNSYPVTYIDVVDNQNGKELGRSQGNLLFGSTATGATKGIDTADNKYYKGYYYSSCTIAEVTTNGATVYRIFKLRTIDVVGSVKWIDNSNKHNTRPSEVYIYLLKDGKAINQVKGLTSTNDNAFSFKNLPKYDTETGKVFTYTVSQSEVESLTNPEDTYKTTQNGYVLTNSLNNFNVEPDPDPIDPPEVKDSYEIKGNISWVDNDDNLGYRPYDIKLTLYKDGVEYASGIYTVDSSKNSFDYAFTNLPKYNENLELHKYTVVQEFQNKSLLTWDESSKKLIEIDAYKVEQTNFNFVNNLADIEDEPIIEVKPEHVNTLNLKLEFNSLIDWKPLNISKEDVDLIITLKQLETIIKNGEATYSNNYSGMTYNTMLTNKGITISNIPSGKYEITTQNSLFELENIKLSNASNMTIIKENGKDYLIIDSTNTNNNGTITFTLNVKDHNGYQTSEGRNNLYQ